MNQKMIIRYALIPAWVILDCRTNLAERGRGAGGGGGGGGGQVDVWLSCKGVVFVLDWSVCKGMGRGEGDFGLTCGCGRVRQMLDWWRGGGGERRDEGRGTRLGGGGTERGWEGERGRRETGGCWTDLCRRGERGRRRGEGNTLGQTGCDLQY